jgi:Bacteriophage probable baseplate hub protein
MPTATAPIPIYSQQETFYIPRVEVYIRGQKLASNIIDDILQVTYKDSINDIDSFTIEINNWDAAQHKFKFAPPSTKDFAGIFDPGAKIELWMGYQDRTRRMMRGTVTSLEPNFPESSPSTLTITGFNELHEFRTEKHTRTWLDGTKGDTDIAKELCRLPVKKGQAGLGIAIDAHPDPNEAHETFVYMSNQYDIVFLLERARRHAYEMYLKDKDGKPALYWGLSEDKANAPVYRLEWGKSLLNFKPRLTTAKQVSVVEVRGWDRKSNSVIDEKYSLDDLWKDQGKSSAEIDRLKQIRKAFEDRTDVVTDKPVRTKTEAKKLARSILEGKFKTLIEASGATVGLPDLRAGVSLEIAGFGAQTGPDGKLQGAGSDFDGEYFVTDTTHTIGSGGYRTEFSARRENPLPDAKSGAKS